MANSDSWLRELADDTGPFHPFRARIIRREQLASSIWNWPPAFLLYKLLRRPTEDLWEHEAMVAIYALDAEPGTLPLAVVPVEPAAVDDDDEGTILVRGIVRPGHGLVLRIEDRVVRPIGPSTIPTLLRKGFRL
jgi:hypothetical protein